MKWFHGVEVVLKSKSAHRQYLTIDHQNQNLFLQYVTKLPYQIMDVIPEEDEASTMESALRGSTRITINKKLVTEQ